MVVTITVMQKFLLLFYRNYINLEKNLGYGGGILKGLSLCKGEIIGWTHADLQTDPLDCITAFKEYEKILANAKKEVIKIQMDSKNILDKDIQSKKDAMEKEIEKRAMELVGADADDPYIKYNKKKLASLLVIWNDYSKYTSLGKNKWALYNTLTHFATHTHETYNIVAQDKHGINYDTEHCTGRIGKNTNALQASNRGKNYTLTEQHDRSRNIAFVVTTPAWQGIGQVA